jgi:glycosyltransferase involved in cell wall biosynthesis
VKKLNILYLYRYAILGGVTTQLANRLVGTSEWSIPHFGFLEDHGGRTAFGQYPHAVIFSPPQQLAEYIHQHHFDLISVIDTPEVYPILRDAGYSGPILHEVHTTTANIQYLKTLRQHTSPTALAIPSRYLRDRILDEFNFRNFRPVFVIPNGLDISQFKPMLMDFQFERPILAWIGKLDAHKNWRHLLTIAQQVRFAMDCAVWVVGGYTARDEVVQELMQEADVKGLMDRLRWIPSVPYQRMPQLYAMVAASGGVCLSTSTDESFGMVVLEALACGCPIIAPAVGAIPELLAEELAVCLYELSSPASAAASVQRLCQDAQLRQFITHHGEKRASQYSVAKLNETHKKVIDDVLEFCSRGFVNAQ